MECCFAAGLEAGGDRSEAEPLIDRLAQPLARDQEFGGEGVGFDLEPVVRHRMAPEVALAMRYAERNQR